jgi:hypothetical protein
MTGAEIAAVLEGATVTYQDGAWQTFSAGATTYHASEASRGTWTVQGDRYCSVWPPAASVACYDVTGDGGDGVRFIADDGTVFEGVIGQ